LKGHEGIKEACGQNGRGDSGEEGATVVAGASWGGVLLRGGHASQIRLMHHLNSKKQGGEREEYSGVRKQVKPGTGRDCS